MGDLWHRGENYVKMLHKEIEHESTRYNAVVGCCEYDYELTGTKKVAKLLSASQ